MAKTKPCAPLGVSLDDLACEVNPKKTEEILLLAITERLDRIAEAVEHVEAKMPGPRYQ